MKHLFIGIFATLLFYCLMVFLAVGFHYLKEEKNPERRYTLLMIFHGGGVTTEKIYYNNFDNCMAARDFMDGQKVNKYDKFLCVASDTGQS